MKSTKTMTMTMMTKTNEINRLLIPRKKNCIDQYSTKIMNPQMLLLMMVVGGDDTGNKKKKIKWQFVIPLTIILVFIYFTIINLLSSSSFYQQHDDRIRIVSVSVYLFFVLFATSRSNPYQYSYSYSTSSFSSQHRDQIRTHLDQEFPATVSLLLIMPIRRDEASSIATTAKASAAPETTEARMITSSRS